MHFPCRPFRLLLFSPLLLFGCLVTMPMASATPPPADSWTRDPAPILTAGARGEDDRLDISIGDPDVWYDEAMGIWHLWYQTGRAVTYTSDDNRMVIRHAWKTGGNTKWIVDREPALSLPDDPSSWDAAKTETPSVVYDPNAPEDRRFKMYYSGASGYHPRGFPDYQIGLAISSDGRTFKRLPMTESPYRKEGLVLRVEDALPDVEGLMDGIIADPEIALIDGVYHLWFSSFANGSGDSILAFGISHATSLDGIHWTPSPENPIPSLRNANNSGGQQPTVAWNASLQLWEMWFTSDTDQETATIPSSFNPAFGFWRATSSDALVWIIDYSLPRDVYWRPDSPDEIFGLLTGAEVVIIDGVRHLFYAGWGNKSVPDGFIVPVRDSRQYMPAVLNLIHATKLASS
jgi:hypothetical protein